MNSKQTVSSEEYCRLDNRMACILHFVQGWYWCNARSGIRRLDGTLVNLKW